jgi:hypothetical protein
MELESVREQLNSIDKQQLPDAWQGVAATTGRYLTWGSSHGQETAKQRFGEKRRWLPDGQSAEPPPSDMKLANDVLTPLGDGGMGRTMYRFTSSFIHTQAYAFTMLLPAQMQYDPQTPNAVPLGVRLQGLTTWLMVTVMAVHNATARCGHYFGWNLREWSRHRTRS